MSLKCAMNAMVKWCKETSEIQSINDLEKTKKIIGMTAIFVGFTYLALIRRK